MKKLALLIIVALFLFSSEAKSQNSDKNLVSVCTEKGHVKPPTGVLTTLMLCPKYLIETPDSTVRVSGGCNTLFYNCMRCHNGVKESEKEIRTVIWRKGK